MRGRAIHYNGDAGLRPMKDRVREAVFNLLGPETVVDKQVVDLFAGTGAMGLEAISRGAAHAIFVERRFPNARVIEQNAADLDVADQATVVPGDAFAWVKREFHPGSTPQLVFCCPPYDFYDDRREDMLALIETVLERAAATSVLMVESDDRFDLSLLPQTAVWDTRRYPPAVISLLEVAP